MDLLPHALRGGQSATPSTTSRQGVLVAGGGGALGAAVLEALLASRAFAPVRVLVMRDFHATVQGLETVDAETLGQTADAQVPLGVVVAATPPSRSRSRPTCCRWRSACWPPAFATCWWCCRMSAPRCPRP